MNKSIEFLENEGISETDIVIFNFNRNRNRNGRECGYHIKGFENGVFNQIGQKISEKINGYDELRILILRGNQVIYCNINGGGEALSITYLKRQIKFIKTNSNWVSIFFQGNHLPIEVCLDSSKDAVDIKNKLLS